MSPLLEAIELVAQRSGGPSIGPFTLRLGRGEWVALVGPNGGGKTTLLRALLGLDEVAGGRVCFGGVALGTGAARLAAVAGMLQEEPRSPLSVREVVSLGLGHPRLLHEEERDRVDELLQRMELTALAQVATSRLSGGEWQRTRLARALLPRARVLVLDEPTNHLPPETRAQVIALLRQELTASALLCATHDPALIAACGRTLHVDRQVTFDARPSLVGSPALVEAP